MADETANPRQAGGRQPEGSPQPSRAAAGETDGISPTTQQIADLEIPEDHAEAIPYLLEQLAEEREMATTRLDDLQRVAAEFENFRKRVQREQEETRTRASQRLIEALLPVLDSFDAAFSHEPQTPGEELLKKGMTSTFHQLMEALEREGLEPIEATGRPFDPEVHEAVTGGVGDDLVVAAELRRGYRLGGRVIRPAMVAVAPAEEGDEQ
jgi:molecular chaperone GrpE